MVGMSLLVIPLHVHTTLGFGPLVVGIIVGGQFVASLLSRPWAGAIADTRGPKSAVMTGFLAASAAGIFYLASLAAIATPLLSLAILMAGRVLLGCAESLIATGSLAWGIARVGPARAGSVMVWVGNAIFAAWALGAPLGGALRRARFRRGRRHRGARPAGRTGFPAENCRIAARRGQAEQLLRGGAQRLAARPGPRVHQHRLRRHHSLCRAAVRLPQVGRGFVCIYRLRRRVHPRAPHVRQAAGPRWRCARRAVRGRGRGAGSVRHLGSDESVAVYVGVALTGIGYSLAFPAFGVEAVRLAPPQSRGTAMGAYVVFLDIALGLTGPVAGFIAGHAGYGAVYLAAGCTMLLGVVVAWRLLQSRRVDSR